MHSQPLSFLCVGVSPKCITAVSYSAYITQLDARHILPPWCPRNTSRSRWHRLPLPSCCTLSSGSLSSFHSDDSTSPSPLSYQVWSHIMLSTASQVHITSYASLRSSHLIKPEQYALGLLSSSSVLLTLYSCTDFVLRKKYPSLGRYLLSHHSTNSFNYSLDVRTFREGYRHASCTSCFLELSATIQHHCWATVHDTLF